jgi:hypothetical protein
MTALGAGSISLSRRETRSYRAMAEGVGFEPTVRLHARRFSRPVP